MTAEATTAEAERDVAQPPLTLASNELTMSTLFSLRNAGVRHT
jgi:hypothetical protein